MLRNYELTVKQVHLSIFWVSNLSSSSAILFPIILLLPTTLLNGMTGIS
jgi:hypothetical protein